MAQSVPSKETLSALRKGAYGGDFEDYSTDKIERIRENIKTLNKTQRKNIKIRNFNLNNLDGLLNGELRTRGIGISSDEKIAIKQIDSAEQAERWGEEFGEKVAELPIVDEIIGETGKTVLKETMGEVGRVIATVINPVEGYKVAKKAVLSFDRVISSHMSDKKIMYHSWARSKMKNKNYQNDFPATKLYYSGLRQKVLGNKKMLKKFKEEQKLLSEKFKEQTGVSL